MDNQNYQSQYTFFMIGFKLFAEKLLAIYPDSKSLSAFLKEWQHINGETFTNKYVKVFDPYSELIESKDVKLMTYNVSFADIKFNKIWKKVKTDNDKSTIWVNLGLLLKIGTFLASKKNITMLDIITEFTSKKLSDDEQKVFDTIAQTLMQLSIKIGAPAKKGKLGIGSIKSRQEEEKDGKKVEGFKPEDFDPEKLGDKMEEILENNPLLGNMVDTKSLDKELAKMTPDKINEDIGKFRTKMNIKETNPLIDSMLSAIGEEASGMNFSDGKNGMKKLIKMATKISKRMKPKIESGEIKMKDIMQAPEQMGMPLDKLGQMPEIAALQNQLRKMGVDLPDIKEMQKHMKELEKLDIIEDKKEEKKEK